MLAPRQLPAVPDRLLNRILVGLLLVLVIGGPAFAAFYWFDRHPAAGPTLADRQIAAAEAAVRAQPNDLAARNTLAAAYVSAGRYDDGIAQFGEVLKSEPANRAALLGRGLAELQVDRLDPARADFQKLVDAAATGEMAATDPQLEQAYYELGAIALRQNRAAAAVPLLESALKIDGADADALFTYGSALIATGDAAEGLTALRQAVAFVPTGWCDPYARMVDGYTALGQRDGVTYAGAMVALCQGRPAEASGKLHSLEAGPFAVDAWLGLALVSAAQADPAAATAYYEKVLAKDPKNPSALIGLSQLGGPAAHAGLQSAAPAASAAAGGSN